ncbi:lipopolysaccharide biosynthesis protein [Oceanobacter mangrovi]|uniref:lipopolysaccharide biosynthesis protein n=1 Tax=Oceanobacter mangrovi TaxID=2862510 RepID=UPI001C8D211B|nr:lipopolysaccharide biosynthesis protein [Oceanobacter mangrovi]
MSKKLAFGPGIVFALIFVLVSYYYGVVATPRYAIETQFVIEESGAQTELSGLASLGAVSSSSKDAQIVKAFIDSSALALALDDQLGLRKHYQNNDIDMFSRLDAGASFENYYEYYQSHVKVVIDDASGILKLEVQAFDPEFAYKLSQAAMDISERFINGLGGKMIKEQMTYIEGEVNRTHDIMRSWQTKLLEFQSKYKSLNPEQEGGAILGGVGELQVEVMKADARLKELVAVMREDAPEVKAQKNLIRSLRAQLDEEKRRLTESGDDGFSQVNMDYQEISMGAELAVDLYKSTLAGMDAVRSQAIQKMKHLLVVQGPVMPEEETYPQRAYKIVTWAIGLLGLYFMITIIVSIIKEHRD